MHRLYDRLTIYQRRNVSRLCLLQYRHNEISQINSKYDKCINFSINVDCVHSTEGPRKTTQKHVSFDLMASETSPDRVIMTSTINFIDYYWLLIPIAHAHRARHDNVLQVAFRLMTTTQLCDRVSDCICCNFILGYCTDLGVAARRTDLSVDI